MANFKLLQNCFHGCIIQSNETIEHAIIQKLYFSPIHSILSLFTMGKHNGYSRFNRVYSNYLQPRRRRLPLSLDNVQCTRKHKMSQTTRNRRRRFETFLRTFSPFGPPILLVNARRE